MKNTKINKIIIFVVTLILLISISNVSLAFPKITPVPTAADKQITNIAGMILGVIRIIGIAVAVIMLVVLAIKYMVSSPGERADIKKSFILYTVGALLLFGGMVFLGAVQSFGEDINSAGGTKVQTPSVTVTT